LVDETFGDFAGTPLRPAATLDPCFISIGSLSKVYGLSVLRCGWIIGSGKSFQAVTEAWLQAQNIGSAVTDAMATVALGEKRFMNWSKKRLIRHRGIVEAKLAGLGDRLEYALSPHGCICFPRVVGMPAEEVAKELESRGVGVVPGRCFRRSQNLRLGFGGFTKEERLEEALDAFCEGVKRAMNRRKRK
jgi:aspartate/methionine/tyrosine aminotransferase